MKKITVNLTKGKLSIGDREWNVTNDVRAIINGRRKTHDPKEVVQSIGKNGVLGVPVDPKNFPIGTWHITAIEKTADPLFAPYKFRTDAWQMCTEWGLDFQGGYNGCMYREVPDYGYHLHYCAISKTTHGCIRLNSAADAEELSKIIEVGDELEVYFE